MGNILAPTSASFFDAIAGGDAAYAEYAVQHPNQALKRLGPKRRNLYHSCAAEGRAEVLQRLCEQVWRTLPDETGRLRDAPPPNGRPHPAILKAINACDQKGRTPLSLACKHGHAEVVRLLLSQGADPWVKDRLMGRTPLHHAARANHPDCIEAILSSPAANKTVKCNKKDYRLVDYPSNSGYTPLHYAASSRATDAAIALCRNGANPNAKTWDVGFDFIQLDRGSTPLHAAARFQNLDVAMALLKHWHDNLKDLEVTDPRVVENLQQLKPYQLPGVKANKALLRVLDPSTPIREISDPFGEATKPVAVGAPCTVLGKGAAARTKPTGSGMPGYQRQDSDQSSSSDGSGGARYEGASRSSTPSNGLLQTHCTAAGASDGSQQRPTGPQAKPPHQQPRPETSSLKVPAGWEDLLLAADGGPMAAAAAAKSGFVSVYRSPDLNTDAATPPSPSSAAAAATTAQPAAKISSCTDALALMRSDSARSACDGGGRKEANASLAVSPFASAAASDPASIGDTQARGSLARTHSSCAVLAAPPAGPGNGPRVLRRALSLQQQQQQPQPQPSQTMSTISAQGQQRSETHPEIRPRDDGDGCQQGSSRQKGARTPPSLPAPSQRWLADGDASIATPSGHKVLRPAGARQLSPPFTSCTSPLHAAPSTRVEKRPPRQRCPTRAFPDVEEGEDSTISAPAEAPDRLRRVTAAWEPKPADQAAAAAAATVGSSTLRPPGAASAMRETSSRRRMPSGSGQGLLSSGGRGADRDPTVDARPAGRSGLARSLSRKLSALATAGLSGAGRDAVEAWGTEVGPSPLRLRSGGGLRHGEPRRQEGRGLAAETDLGRPGARE